VLTHGERRVVLAVIVHALRSAGFVHARASTTG